MLARTLGNFFFGSLFAIAACDAMSANDLLKKGETLYKQCQGCHQIGPDAINQFGPPLNGLTIRGAGKLTSYEYSAAFVGAVEKGLTWDNETLDAFLAKPMDYVPGTKMAFPGVSSDEDRKALIAFLNNIDDEGAFLIEPGREAKEEAKEEAEEQATPKPRSVAAEGEVPTHGILHLGRKALREEIVAWDIDVRPDGLGLPPGKGNAIDGIEIYDAQCAACHGDFGEGVGRWPILAGGADTLSDERPEKTIGSYWPYLSTVYDYVRRAMPFGNARSLSNDDVYAVTAYLLYLNDLAPEDFELSSENFMTIQMPNSEGFISDERSQESHYFSSETPCMSDCIAGDAVVTQRARILDVTPDE